MIYLDWNASAPLRHEARDAWLAAQQDTWANPSSVHGAGRAARHAIDQAKAVLARQLGCRPFELVLTSGGTEANALAIHAARAATGRNVVVAAASDHSSILRAAEPALRPVPVDGCGRLDPECLAAACTEDTALVCLQFANNETGVRQDIPELVAAVRRACPGIMIHLDCCQGMGKTAIDLAALGVDLAACAGHKFGAPKGTGLCFTRTGFKVEPFLRGGRQQQDRRSGTEDAPGACALAAALTAACVDMDAVAVAQRDGLTTVFARIQRDLPQATWIADGAPRLANTLSLGHPGVVNELLVQRLDLAGICVSTGSACMAARGQPSHVIAAMGVAPAVARSVIRVSIGHQTTGMDLDAFADAYVDEVRALIAP